VSDILYFTKPEFNENKLNLESGVVDLKWLTHKMKSTVHSFVTVHTKTPNAVRRLHSHANI
jgi:hypothetical protein